MRVESRPAGRLVKLPPFAYRATTDVDEALAVLAEHGDDAAVLAGGQSLLLDLRYGRTASAVLVDINRVDAFGGLRSSEGALRIGALVRHDAFERPATDAAADRPDPLSRLLARIAPYIGHPPIRARGTFVGSLAWAHPAAEWCATARALAAEVVLRSRAQGERIVPAADWFTGAGRTARRGDELMTEVRLPRPATGTGIGFAEHRRTSASFALAAALATVRFEDDRVVAASVGLANAADVPLSAERAVAALVGSAGSGAALDEAAEMAARDSDPHGEPHCSAEYRRHVLRVLVRRALGDAAQDAGQSARPEETA